MKDENKIIQAITAGDSEQYRKLVERYQTGLIIHCENMVKSRSDGEDIAQEAFIKAYQTLDKFNPEKAQFSTWLYKIATNKAIDYLRKSNRTINHEDIEKLADTTMPGEMTEDEIAALRQAVDVLEPPVYAQVIKAYFWEGKSYTEIAKELDTTTGTVGTWMSRAKAQLKEALV